MTTVDSGLRSRLFEMLIAEKAQDVFSGMGFEFSETLDRICELAVDLTGFDAAAICLFNDAEVKPIGGYNFPRKNFPRKNFPRFHADASVSAAPRPGAYGYIADLIANHGALGIVDGTLENYRSAAFALISVEEEHIGALLLLSNRRNFPSTFDVEAYAVDLAALAKVVIVSKAKLKLIMMDAFSLASK